MSTERKNIKPRVGMPEGPLESIGRTHIGWEKSKEAIWAELEKKVDASGSAKHTVLIRPWMKIAAAAMLALVTGISLFMQVYTKSMTIPAGMHSSLILPDGSKVVLNAQTTITYKPLLWLFTRKVRLEGEAFFEVNPGKKFEVVSKVGKTVVLGTSFNIYTRNSNYNVTCVTGKVRVSENTGRNEVVILRGQRAVLSSKGTLDILTGTPAEQSISWIENKLSFTSVPLKQVFDEIGRQYGIVILIPNDLENTYTGTFRRNLSIEQSLNLVCKPFNLNFSRKSKDEYTITRNH
jgi:transmembrane sensor